MLSITHSITVPSAILISPFPHYISSQSNRHDSFPNTTRELRISRYSNRHALRNTKERNMRSKIRWFTEFCNSHYVSHFAAFFIVARAKRSVVKSCFLFVQENQDSFKFMVKTLRWAFLDRVRTHQRQLQFTQCTGLKPIVNDPTAGSPTVTLLRLVLPLNDQVWPASQ